MTQLALAMFKSDGTRRDFPLVKDRVVIGRKVNCDLRIPLTSVSRQHCELIIDDGTVSVKDLGSSNGTYHNSVRVQEANLSAGDELVVGPVVFTLIVDGQPEDIKPIRTIVKNDSSGSHVAVAQKSAPPAPAATAELEEDEDLDLSEMLEDEAEGSSIELDDDPITALESLAGGDDSDEFDDIEFFLDDDDDR
ncbi:MAG: FHA domain-containing protein [Phycisphaeraceae bacterium]|jgi:pSer/pThr/pTyr-binding forkhead associated (FHA) protein